MICACIFMTANETRDPYKTIAKFIVHSIQTNYKRNARSANKKHTYDWTDPVGHVFSFAVTQMQKCTLHFILKPIYTHNSNSLKTFGTRQNRYYQQ